MSPVSRSTHHTRCTTLHTTHTPYSALEVLQVSGNLIEALPPAALALPALRELLAARNQIAELAGPVHLLTALQVRVNV